MIRTYTLEQLQGEINRVAEEWHRLIRRQDGGESMGVEIEELQDRLDRLWAEKRWLKAGGVVLAEDLMRELQRIDQTIRQSHFAGVESYAW